MDTTLNTTLGKFNAFEGADQALNPLRVKKARLEQLIASHQKVIERLDRRLAKEGKKGTALNPWGNCAYLEPLAQAIISHFPGMAWRIRGPFGLGNTGAIANVDPAKGSSAGCSSVAKTAWSATWTPGRTSGTIRRALWANSTA